MKIECPLLNITLSNDAAASRIRILIDEAVSKMTLGEEYYELHDLLVISSFEWPAFLEWDRTFNQLSFEPRNWADVASAVVKEDDRMPLDALKSLPQTVRHALLESQYPMSVSAFVQKHGQDTLNELLKIGKVKVMTTAFEKLPHIPLEHLRGIQRRLGIKGGRSRVEAAEKIRKASSEEAVTQLLLPEYKEDFVAAHSVHADVDEQWLFQRKRLVSLYLQTLNCFLSFLRNLLAGGRLGSALVFLDQKTDCPICKPHQGKEAAVAAGQFPPFHPGCICSVFPECIYEHLG
jgi:hypothetical protein